MEVHASSVLATARGSSLPYRILGIDLSPVHTGLVILNETGLIMRAATIDYAIKKEKHRPKIEEGARIQRMLCVANDIIGTVKQFRIQMVAMEGAIYGNNQAYKHHIGEVSGSVKTQLWLASHIVPIVVAATAARKHFLGNGTAKKDEIMMVLKRLGMDFETNHESDAYLVARYLYDDLVMERKCNP